MDRLSITLLRIAVAAWVVLVIDIFHLACSVVDGFVAGQLGEKESEYASEISNLEDIEWQRTFRGGFALVSVIIWEFNFWRFCCG